MFAKPIDIKKASLVHTIKRKFGQNENLFIGKNNSFEKNSNKKFE